jgi:hypothetical protein
MKNTIKKIRKATNWEKIFAKKVSDKGLVFKTYKELSEVNNKRTKSTI